MCVCVWHVSGLGAGGGGRGAHAPCAPRHCPALPRALAPPPPTTAPGPRPAQDLVAARTREGRKLRRSVLKGSVVVFVTAGYSGKRFIFQKAKELGVRSVVLDGPDRCVGGWAGVGGCMGGAQLGPGAAECQGLARGRFRRRCGLPALRPVLLAPGRRERSSRRGGRSPRGAWPAPNNCARSWVKLLEQEGVIEKFVPIDFTEAETVFERCLKVRAGSRQCTRSGPQRTHSRAAWVAPQPGAGAAPCARRRHRPPPRPPAHPPRCPPARRRCRTCRTAWAASTA